jgi:hypothetical protein
LGELPNSRTEESGFNQDVTLSRRYEIRIDVGHSLASGLGPLLLLPAACCLPALSAWLLTQGPLANARVYETDNEESKDSDPEMRALREMRQIEARISTRAFQFKADPRPVRSINDVSNDTREQALK